MSQVKLYDRDLNLKKPSAVWQHNGTKWKKVVGYVTDDIFRWRAFIDYSWWLTFQNNIRHTGVAAAHNVIYVGSWDYYLYALNPDGSLKWSFDAGDAIDSGGPVVDKNGTIYFGVQQPVSKVYALKSDGTEKWSYKTGSSVVAAPAIGEDGTVYIGSMDNKFYALNPDGTLRWSYKTGGYVTGHATIDYNGTIYVGSHDNNLYAFNPNGTLRWKFTAVARIKKHAPTIGKNGTIYIGTDGGDPNKIYAINPIKREEGVDFPAEGEWSIDVVAYINNTPAVSDDGTIYIGSDNGTYYTIKAINPDGTVKWDGALGDIITSSPAIGLDGTIYVGCQDNSIYAVNPDGTLKWSNDLGDEVNGSPSVAPDGTVYVGAWTTKFYALNPNDGSLKWSYDTGDQVKSGSAII